MVENRKLLTGPRRTWRLALLLPLVAFLFEPGWGGQSHAEEAEPTRSAAGVRASAGNATATEQPEHAEASQLTASAATPGKDANADQKAERQAAEARERAREQAREQARQARQRQRELVQLEKEVKPLLEDHLPDLIPLVNRLKIGQPKLYYHALVQLGGAARRVESAQSKSPVLHEIELEALKANTQVNLIGARLQVRDSKRDRQELQTAVQRLYDAEERRLEWVVSQIEDRVEMVQQQLETATQRLAEKRRGEADLIANQYERLLRKAGRNKSDPPPTKSSSKESKRE